MSENELILADAISDNIYNLESAQMALNEIIEAFDYNYEPDARKALEYGNTVHANKYCDEDAKHSWEYLYGYKKIMWLVKVARDYCHNAIDCCEKIQCGGICHE